jgi:flagellar protein FlaJ
MDNRPTIPLALIPPKLLFELSAKLRAPGSSLALAFPALDEDLHHAGYLGIDATAYAAACLLNAVLSFVFVFAAVLAIGLVANKPAALPALGIGLVVGVAILGTCLVYPQVVAKRVARTIETNLIPAVRHMLIEIRSGVPLFNALVSASTGYPRVSDDLSRIVQRLNAGVSEIDALSEASQSSPSWQFRKVMWQLSNALKVGSDIGVALEGTLSELQRDQAELIKRYAQELSPLTLVYMLAAVVLPSLGITMIIIIGSLLSVPLPPFVMPLLFLLLVGFQLFFLNFVSTRRPSS